MNILFRVLVVLAFCCLAGHGIVHAQSWREMHREADSLAGVAFGPSAVRGLELAKEALRLAEQEAGPRDTSVARILTTCAALLLNASIGKVDEAQAYASRALAIFEGLYGPDHPTVGDALTVLAATGRYRKDPDEALVLLQRARSIFERNGLDTTAVFGSLLHQIAFTAQQTGDYYYARDVYAQALTSLRSSLPPEDPFLAYPLTMGATNYWALGLFHEAEPLLREALHVWQKAYGENSMQSAICNGNLYEHFLRQGNREEGEVYARRSAELSRQHLPPTDPFFGATLLLTGLTLKEEGRYREAIDSLVRAEMIYAGMKEISGRVVRTNMWIGECHLALHEYGEAERRARRGLAFRDSLFPGKNERGLDIHLFLARCLAHRGLHAEADTLCAEVVAQRRQQFGEENPAVAAALEARGECALLAGNVTGSMTFLGDAIDMRTSNFVLNARMLPEKDARAYAQYLKRAVDGWLSGYLGLADPDREQTAHAARIILSTKGQATEQAVLRQHELAVHTDPAIAGLLRRYRSVKFQLAKRYVSGLYETMPEGSRMVIDSLEDLSRSLEAALARSGMATPFQQPITVTAHDVSVALPSRGTLVEYLRFHRTTMRSDTRRPGYLALILTAEGEAKVVDLGDAGVVDSVVEVYRAHMRAVGEAGQWRNAATAGRYRAIAKRLMDLLWSPCVPHLSRGGPMFISPDGGLHLVSFSGLCGTDGRFLVEQYPVHYVATGRDLMRREEVRASTRNCVAFGDPDFDAPAPMRRASEAVAARTTHGERATLLRNVRSDCASFRTAVFSRLPGTATEVRAIMRYWKTRAAQGAGVAFLGSRASEESFKENASGSRVLHIATHGYYLEVGEQSERTTGGSAGENPLLRSGVVLAGANLHGTDAGEGGDDGVLTALEVSAMDLRGTELVVLSACESGLGKMEQGEGVYGLRRAFQMAGVRTVVSSLWRVPDAETVKFMQALYMNGALSYPELMRKAALERIAEARMRGRSTHPFMWGGFVAMGEWRKDVAGWAK